MKGQDIHNYVWNRIYYSRRAIAKDEIDLKEVKRRAVQELYERGDISCKQMDELNMSYNCVLCVEYRCRCRNCPLRECTEDYSVYSRAIQGDAMAIDTIRNIKIHRNKCLG